MGPCNRALEMRGKLELENHRADDNQILGPDASARHDRRLAAADCTGQLQSKRCLGRLSSPR